MAEENAQSAAGEGGKPQDPAVEAQPQDTKPEEGGKPQDSGGVEGNDRTPNVHKLERDVANRDKTIAELKAKLAEKEKGGKRSRGAPGRSREAGIRLQGRGGRRQGGREARRRRMCGLRPRPGGAR